jgi:hypothetical protein
MSLFQLFRDRLFNKKDINISKKDILGEWLYRTDLPDESTWIFFAFYNDGICEYLDDEDEARAWHYDLSGGQLKLWGADKSKAESLEIYLNGENLIINGTEYVRSEKIWRS